MTRPRLHTAASPGLAQAAAESLLRSGHEAGPRKIWAVGEIGCGQDSSSRGVRTGIKSDHDFDG